MYLPPVYAHMYIHININTDRLSHIILLDFSFFSTGVWILGFALAR
jgi:hypothetical protein